MHAQGSCMFKAVIDLFTDIMDGFLFVSPVQYFKDPSLTPYEIEKAKRGETSADVSEEALKVFESLSAFTDREHTEK